MNDQTQPAMPTPPTEPTPPVAPVATPEATPTPTPPPAPAPAPVAPAPAPAPAPMPAPGTDASASTSETTQAQPSDEPSVIENVGLGFKAFAGAIFSWIILPIAIVLILHNFVFQAYHVLGTSMVNTLHETDYLIISKLGYTEALVGRIFGRGTQYIPGRGQIIVFHYPKDPSKVFVKRVVGLPGDRVVIQNGTVTVYNKANPNGFNPDKKYEASDTTTLIDTDEVVQPGNVFVMGDNRSPGGSYDSREWGQLPSSYIIGNAVLRLIPLDQVRIF